MSIVKLKTFGANFTGSLPFWADGTKAHKIALMCVDVVKSKYQLLNKCKLLFRLGNSLATTLTFFLATFQFVLRSLREISPNVTFILKRREYNTII
jgi:hypothetical protein